MIIKAANNLKIKDKNGAIIIGKNSTGKSKILERILKNVDKKINVKDSFGKKIDDPGIWIDNYFHNGAEHDNCLHVVKYFGSHDSNKKNLDGATSTISKELNKVNKLVKETINQPDNIFDSTTWNQYQKDFQKHASTQNKSSILGSGIELKYKNKITKELISLEMVIIFDGVTYDLEKASSGVKQIISIMLSSIEFEKEQEKLSEIILLDEPECYLHPSWYRLLVKLINGSIELGNKVIIVTHNPFFLSLLLKKEENIRMLSKIKWGEKEDDGTISTIDFDKVINDIHNNESSLNSVKRPKNKNITWTIDYIKTKLINLLTPQICEGMYSDDLIIVEGVTDFFYFRNIFPDKTIIDAYGFWSFYFYGRLFNELDIYPKFIIDNDEYQDNGATKITPENDFMYKEIDKDNSIYRMKKDLENYLYGIPASKQSKQNKFDMILDFLSHNNKPIDPDNEKINLENFINT